MPRLVFRFGPPWIATSVRSTVAHDRRALATGRLNRRVRTDDQSRRLYASMRAGVNWQSTLCQNCVRFPLKPRSNTVIYGDTPMHIVVAGSR